MAKISFLDCPHNNVQQFTEMCLDYGFNIYMTKKEYLKYLEQEAVRKGVDKTTEAIRDLERKLDIKGSL